MSGITWRLRCGASTHKYVVSTPLKDPTWGPVTVLPHDAAEIRALTKLSLGASDSYSNAVVHLSYGPAT